VTALDRERQKPARARASRIRLGIADYLDLLATIAKAREEGDHITLGYETWQAYVDAEYGDARLRLAPEMRRKAVIELRLAGASQREIGHTLGVSPGTVNADLARVQDRTPTEESPLVEAVRRQSIEDLSGVSGGTGEVGRSSHDEVPTSPTATSPAPSRLQRQENTGGAATPPESPEVAASADPEGLASSPSSESGPQVGAGGREEPSHGPATSGGSSHDNLVDTPIGPMSPAVAAAAGIDPEAAAWKKKFFASIVAARKVMRAEVEDVVRLADEEAVTELHRVARDLSSYSDRIAAELAAVHDNVTPLRRVK